MKNLYDYFPDIAEVKKTDIELKESFIDIAGRFSALEGTTVLLSGGDLDCSGFNILGIKPWMSVKAKAEKTEISVSGEKKEIIGDTFVLLKRLLIKFRVTAKDEAYPIRSGLLGYLSYDLKNSIEKIPTTVIDPWGLPDLCLYAPSLILIQDKRTKKSSLFVTIFEDQNESEAEKLVNWFKDEVAKPYENSKSYSGGAEGLKSNFTKSEYVEAVERVKEYIRLGHVYQVNMSQRFELDFQGDAYSLFCDLFSKNPAPFFSYVNAGDHKIVSTSPERFVQRNGCFVETRPIKGTIKRGKSPEEDKKLGKTLSESRKDDAELSMIVDLMRNDIGKVCEGGSVRVVEHKRLEAYENVFHLVSVVEGRLKEGADSCDLIKATFPGGSITGCPKVRAMEIIDELETSSRHLYTGSVGYISFHDTVDLSIAIRTATIFQNRISFSVGGGVVYDSDPEGEYEETIHKGKTLMEAFSGNDSPVKNNTESSSYIWTNGKIVDQESATVSVSDTGFQYGYGFFETIRVDKGVSPHLHRHIERFTKTWVNLFNGNPQKMSWDEIVRQVVEANSLSNQTAAVKIIASKGTNKGGGENVNIFVSARPYTHRLDAIGKKGLDIGVYPEPRETPLADYKTLNYLYYHLAGNWAKENGYDEALIKNSDGSISEACTAGIILIKGNRVFLPQSSHVLPGIMESAVTEYLGSLGYYFERKKLYEKDIVNADTTLLTNALMGAVPVLSVNKQNINGVDGLCEKMNKVLL